MKRISLVVDQETYDALNELFDEIGITNRSAFFRKAIVSYINNFKEYQDILTEIRSIKAILLENPVRKNLTDDIPTDKPKNKLKHKRGAAIAVFSSMGDNDDES